MKKNFALWMNVGIYAAAMGAILYIYKKNVDKQTAALSTYMDAISKPFANFEEE